MLPLQPSRKAPARRPQKPKAVRHKPAGAKGSGPLVHASSGGGGGGGRKRKKPDAGADVGEQDAVPAPKAKPRARKQSQGAANEAGASRRPGRGRGRGRGGNLEPGEGVHGTSMGTPARGGRARGRADGRASTPGSPNPGTMANGCSSADAKTLSDLGSARSAGSDGCGSVEAQRAKRKSDGICQAREGHDGAAKGKGAAAAASPGTAKRFRGADNAPGGSASRRNRGELEYENQMLMAYQARTSPHVCLRSMRAAACTCQPGFGFGKQLLMQIIV